jgi:hypothetical protein
MHHTNKSTEKNKDGSRRQMKKYETYISDDIVAIG